MTERLKIPLRRVVVVNWKSRADNSFEVFSNLKILCVCYPQYNYNTLSNYLSRNKMAFENEEVKIERKIIQTKPLPRRKMAMVVNKFHMKKHDQDVADLKYWLTRPVDERLAAVTSLNAQYKTPGQRMDKTKVVKRKIKR